MERQWNDINWGKPKDLEKNLFLHNFFHHKSHMIALGQQLTICIMARP
jgi:hypothetical protein